MDRLMYVGDRPMLVLEEQSDAYILIDYAPDGQGTGFTVAKEDCYTDPKGYLYASEDTLHPEPSWFA